MVQSSSFVFLPGGARHGSRSHRPDATGGSSFSSRARSGARGSASARRIHGAAPRGRCDTRPSRCGARSVVGSRRPMDGSLYIVDALNYLFRAFHALPPLTTVTGLQTGAVYGLAQMLLKLEREQKPTHLCVVFDAPGPNFRHQIYSGYKADRPPMPPELAAQVEMTHKVIDAFALPVLA